MITVDDIPKEWLAMLANLEAQGYFAMIAGGALRDLDNDRPIKDVDIFVCPRNYTTGVIWDKLAELNGWTKQIDMTYFRDNEDIRTLYQFSTVRPSPMVGSPHTAGWDYQFITLKRPMSPVNILRRIDMGLCRIGVAYWHDPSTPVMFAMPEYLSDVENKTCTLLLTDCPRAVKRSQGRWERISAKYPEFTFHVNPEPFCADS